MEPFNRDEWEMGEDDSGSGAGEDDGVADVDEFADLESGEDSSDECEIPNGDVPLEAVRHVDGYWEMGNWNFTRPEGFPEERHIPHRNGAWKDSAWENRDYKKEPGASTSATPCFSAREFFSVFFPDAWYARMASRTNLYAHRLTTGLNPKLKYKWEDTTIVEMMCLHAMLIFMSIKNLGGGFMLHWEQPDPWGEPWIKSLMGYAWFKVLMRMLHVVDEVEDPPGDDDNPKDPTLKVRLWFHQVNNRVRAVWDVTEKVCIDETMTKGTSNRNPVRQIMGDKPIPVGTKSFSAVDEAGICFYQMIYRGRRGVEKAVWHLSLQVIMEILDYLPSPGHTVVADNWYGLYAALEAIKEAGHQSLLMMRRPKKLKDNSPLHAISALHKLATIVNKKSERGASIATFMLDPETHKGRAMVEFWRDNEVVVLTDMFGPGRSAYEQQHVMRTQKGVSGSIQVPATDSVVAYNQMKSYVDRFNDAKTECDHKTAFKRWWPRVFINCILAESENNAWKAALWLKQRCMSFRQFRQELAMELAALYQAQKVPVPLNIGIPAVGENNLMIPYGHQLVKLEKSEKRQICVGCAKHSHCGFMCSVCHLPCHEACFSKLIHIKSQL